MFRCIFLIDLNETTFLVDRNVVLCNLLVFQFDWHRISWKSGIGHYLVADQTPLQASSAKVPSIVFPETVPDHWPFGEWISILSPERIQGYSLTYV